MSMEREKGSADWLREDMAMLTTFWVWISDQTKVLLACRFSTFFSAVGFVFFVVLGQGREFLRALGEDMDDPYFYLHLLFFLLALLAWVLTTWLTSIALLAKPLPRASTESDNIRGFKDVIPRQLGMVNIVWVALGLAIVGQLWLVVFHLLLLLIFLRAASGLEKQIRSVLAKEYRLEAPARLNRLLLRKEDEPQLRITFSSLTVTLTVVLAFSWLLFIGFVWSQVWLPQLVGASAILLFAAASWIVFGNYFLTYLPRMRRTPTLVAALFVWAALISSCNDNHRIREVSGTFDPSHTVTIEKHFDDWFKANAQGHDPGKPFPVVIVAAEGGGIRAAYWTATLLAEIQNQNPEFSKHLYAISGVSGGSLGAAVFDALLAEGALNKRSLCRIDQGDESNLVRCASAILSSDFLSPALAALLYTDLVQRFWPRPVESLDRARALEASWGNAWKAHVGSDRFERSFDTLWEGDLKYRVPALFLNGTWVEEGKRIIISNLRIDSETFNDTESAFSLIDFPVSLSTAVHMGARFTYVSPAGTLQKRSASEPVGHVVDGGYFENSGTATALDILAKIDERTEELNLYPIIIYISNTPGELETVQPSKLARPERWLTEIWAPIDTLFNSRVARGTYSQALLKGFVEADVDALAKRHYFAFGLKKEKNPPPLGWFLSHASRKDIDDQRMSLVATKQGDFAELMKVLRIQ